MRKLSIIPSTSAGSPVGPDDAGAGAVVGGVQPVHERDLPLLHVGRAAHDLGGSPPHGHDAVGAGVQRSSVGPRRRDDAPAGLAVGEHRQADAAVHLLHGGHDLVADVGDPVVHGLRVASNGGGTGVHATTPLVCRRRPGGIAAPCHVPRPRPAIATVGSRSGTDRQWAHSASSAEEHVRRRFLVEPRWVGLGLSAQAGRPGDPGDPTRGADDQRAVGEQLEVPVAGEGLDPVMPAAEAAEVPAVGRAAVGVGDAVVDVAAAGRAPAAGHPARAVARPGRSASAARVGR